MKSFSRPKVLGRAVALVALDVALALGLLVWFDFLGLVDVRSVFAPVYGLFGAQTRNAQLPSDLPTLLEDERYAKRLEEIDLFRQELVNEEFQLVKKQAEIVLAEQNIDEKGKAADEREKSFNELVKAYDDRKANVDQIAANLTGMEPKKAVSILLDMEDRLVIDVLRAVEEMAAAEGTASIVPFWLSLMPPDRSAAIQRLSTVSPVEITP